MYHNNHNMPTGKER